MELYLSMGAIVVLMLVSAFLAAAETALIGASAAKMLGLEQKGDRRAGIVNRLRADRDTMLGALLLGNNLVNILASALATGVLISLFGAAGVFYATAIMTAVIVIFAEIMPKTYAVYQADKVAMVVAVPVRLVSAVFSPVTKCISAIVRATLHLFGVQMPSEGESVNVEELRGAIEMHDDPDEDAHERRAMLRSILDLGEVWVQDVMTHRTNMSTISLDQSLDDIVQAVLNNPHTRIPAWKDTPDNIAGVIDTKTLLRELQSVSGDLKKISAEKLVSEPWFVPNTTTLSDQLRAFRQRREHFAMVVDEYGTLMGLVTLEDILEEIVGDMDEDHDIAVPGVRRQANGSYLIDGTVTIRDLNREFDWDLPSEHYSTMAGLVLFEAKAIPDAGQVFNFHGFRFDIIRRQRNQITLVRVTPPKG